MNEVIYNALCACFRLSPSSAEASVLIREAYQEPENAPRPPRNTDVIYYSVSPDAAAPEAPPAYTADIPGQASHVPAVSAFSAWTLQIVCYGPYALRKAGVYPVPDPPEPVLLHEPEGSLWRKRADLTVSLRAEETKTHPVRRGAVTVAPAVILHRESRPA